MGAVGDSEPVRGLTSGYTSRGYKHVSASLINGDMITFLHNHMDSDRKKWQREDGKVY